MMLQRLNHRGTLVSAVQLLIAGAAEPLLVGCRRVRQKRISCRAAEGPTRAGSGKDSSFLTTGDGTDSGHVARGRSCALRDSIKVPVAFELGWNTVSGPLLDRFQYPHESAS